MKQVTADLAFAALKENKQTVFLDVRTAEEFSKTHIDGAINIPLDHLQDDVEKKVADKTQPIYVYCLSGSRSYPAAMIMEHLGYTNVFDVKSGLLAWRAQQLPLVS